MNKSLGLCDSCKNKIEVIKETSGDFYDYKYKGKKYDKESICKVTSRHLYFFNPVIKCDGYDKL